MFGRVVGARGRTFDSQRTRNVIPGLALLQSTTAFSSGITGYFKNVGPVGAFVLAVLVLFSLMSWAIIIYKGASLRRAHSQSDTFLQVFRKSSKFSEVNSVCAQLKASPLVGVFQAGYMEVNQQVRGQGAKQEGKDKDAAGPKPTVRSLDALSRALARAATVESTRIERRLSFLATTATVTPFIGLFGTVWGIMDAFATIGATQTSSITAVAPGISEALINTAAGLFAAIPALLAYNHFVQRLRQARGEMEDFTLEFLNLTERNFM